MLEFDLDGDRMLTGWVVLLRFTESLELTNVYDGDSSIAPGGPRKRFVQGQHADCLQVSDTCRLLAGMFLLFPFCRLLAGLRLSLWQIGPL